MHFSWKQDCRTILMVVIASVVMAVNINTFVMTGGLYPGGVTGLTLLIQRFGESFFGVHLPFALVNILLNLIPIYIGFRYIGKKFTMYSCLMIGLTAFLIDVIPGHIVTEDILLISIFGGIINGIAVTGAPMTDDMGSPISDDECYPLCIDANGDLSAPYERSVDTATMIADGVKYAVTAWGQFIENFAKADSSKYNEIVHAGKYIRQSIGQFQTGDYFVCTVDCSRGSISNEAGMTYDTLANLLISKGVKFAYSLDGGGSAETVIEKRQINPIFEGTSGRAVPTVIYFDVE